MRGNRCIIGSLYGGFSPQDGFNLRSLSRQPSEPQIISDEMGGEMS
jgi:hypothetical protein